MRLLGVRTRVILTEEGTGAGEAVVRIEDTIRRAPLGADVVGAEPIISMMETLLDTSTTVGEGLLELALPLVETEVGRATQTTEERVTGFI